MGIKAELGTVGTLEAELGAFSVTITDGEKYTGLYTVTPATYNEQILGTKNKTMSDNVTVERIPVYEVANNSGGNTLTIGIESM